MRRFLRLIVFAAALLVLVTPSGAQTTADCEPTGEFECHYWCGIQTGNWFSQMEFEVLRCCFGGSCRNGYAFTGCCF